MTDAGRLGDPRGVVDLSEELDAPAPPASRAPVVHGDFRAGENVHYVGSRFAGVIDFGATHLDDRPEVLDRPKCVPLPRLLACFQGDPVRLDHMEPEACGGVWLLEESGEVANLVGECAGSMVENHSIPADRSRPTTMATEATPGSSTGRGSRRQNG